MLQTKGATISLSVEALLNLKLVTSFSNYNLWPILSHQLNKIGLPVGREWQQQCKIKLKCQQLVLLGQTFIYTIFNSLFTCPFGKKYFIMLFRYLPVPTIEQVWHSYGTLTCRSLFSINVDKKTFPTLQGEFSTHMLSWEDFWTGSL